MIKFELEYEEYDGQKYSWMLKKPILMLSKLRRIARRSQRKDE